MAHVSQFDLVDAMVLNFKIREEAETSMQVERIRTGAEWVLAKAWQHPGSHIALIGPTAAHVREEMVKRGILAVPTTTPQPTFKPSKRMLEFENGSRAYSFSTNCFHRLCGPEFHFAWIDEAILDVDEWNAVQAACRKGEAAFADRYCLTGAGLPLGVCATCGRRTDLVTATLPPERYLLGARESYSKPKPCLWCAGRKAGYAEGSKDLEQQVRAGESLAKLLLAAQTTIERERGQRAHEYDQANQSVQRLLIERTEIVALLEVAQRQAVELEEAVRTGAGRQLVRVRELLESARNEVTRSQAEAAYSRAVAMEATEQQASTARVVKTLEQQVVSLDDKRRQCERELVSLGNRGRDIIAHSQVLEEQLLGYRLRDQRVRSGAIRLGVGVLGLAAAGGAAAVYWQTLGPWLATAWEHLPATGDWPWALAVLLAVLVGRRWGRKSSPRGGDGVARPSVMGAAQTVPAPAGGSTLPHLPDRLPAGEGNTCTQCGKAEPVVGGLCVGCDEADWNSNPERRDQECRDFPELGEFVPQPLDPDPELVAAWNEVERLRCLALRLREAPPCK